MSRWIQTIACTKPVQHVKSRWRWEKIWDGLDSHVPAQIWVCQQDLKESFVKEAKEAFGKSLEQVVRLGSHLQVLYPGSIEGEE
jgi:hypothetical protein